MEGNYGEMGWMENSNEAVLVPAKGDGVGAWQEI